MNQSTKMYSIEGYRYLVAWVLRSAVKNPDYYRGPCGRYFADIANIGPEVMFRYAVKGTEREGEIFTPLGICPDPECYRPE